MNEIALIDEAKLFIVLVLTVICILVFLFLESKTSKTVNTKTRFPRSPKDEQPILGNQFNFAKTKFGSLSIPNLEAESVTLKLKRESGNSNE
jgi:Ca2+/Na+ antiporter